jgi:hypothetical protein
MDKPPIINSDYSLSHFALISMLFFHLIFTAWILSPLISAAIKEKEMYGCMAINIV